MWCDHCKDDCPTLSDLDSGSICCSVCGKVLTEDFLTDGPTFVKTSSGQCLLSGAVQRMATDYSLSRERTLNKGRDEISNLVDDLNISGADSVINPAYNFYKIAVERNFTKGRPTSHVAAACLYIACRQRVPMLPYLLIDFSNFLMINVYVLGAVFLQLCKLLSLEEHPIVQKPVDPSLFMDRFTRRLLGKDDRKITRTALNIIASMKRDWMQTGRKPSGLCGAALYISVHAHQLTYSKAAIVNVVHVCEATLTKRLIEFENTESGSLTAEELDEMAEDLRQELSQRKPPSNGCEGSGITELLCQHKNAKPQTPSHYAHGLCKECYDDFMEISGGLQGASEPPAFQRAEMQRKEKAEKEKKEVESSDLRTPVEESNIQAGRECHAASGASPLTGGASSMPKTHEEVSAEQVPDNDSTCDGSPEIEKGTESEDDETDLSDIDDIEVEGYLHTEEEKHYKKIIWEEMNKEYLEEQAAKEASAAAAREELVAMYGDDKEGLHAALELAAASAAAVAKSRKEKREKRAEEAKKLGPAKTAAEATSQMLKRKTFSSKINYAALNALYTSCGEGDAKKQRTEANADDIYEDQHDANKDDNLDYDAPEGENYDKDGKADVDYDDDVAGDEFNDEEYYGDDDYYPPGGDYNEEYDEGY